MIGFETSMSELAVPLHSCPGPSSRATSRMTLQTVGCLDPGPGDGPDSIILRLDTHSGLVRKTLTAPATDEARRVRPAPVRGISRPAKVRSPGLILSSRCFTTCSA